MLAVGLREIKALINKRPYVTLFVYRRLHSRRSQSTGLVHRYRAEGVRITMNCDRGECYPG